MTRVAILGGGGYFGAALARAAHRRGWAITLSTRTDGVRAALDGIPHDRRIGDDSAPGAPDAIADSADLVIDAAAPYALALHEPQASHAQRVARAQARMAALLAATRATGAPLIYVGSYLTRQPGGPLRRMIAASHPYFAIKDALLGQAEEAARTGQPVCIVNPSAFFGPGNPRPAAQCYTASVLEGLLPARVPDSANIIDVRDAAELTLRAAEAGLFGKPVTLSGHNVAIDRLTARIAELAGVQCPPRVPGLAAGAALLYALEHALALAGRQTRWPSLPVLLTLASHTCPIGAAQASLGHPLRPLDETIRDEIAWLRAPTRASDRPETVL